MRRLAAAVVLLFLLAVPSAGAWTWPVAGPVLQPFSFEPAHPYAGGQHRGVDIGADSGATVVSPVSGTVTFAGSVPSSGKSLSILTADSLSVTLTHLGSLAVAKGAEVGEGATVGTIGPSGDPEVTVPYVHLGVRTAADDNGYLDPLGLLPPLSPAAPPAPAPMPEPAPPADPVTTPAPAPPPVDVAIVPVATAPIDTTPVQATPPPPVETPVPAAPPAAPVVETPPPVETAPPLQPAFDPAAPTTFVDPSDATPAPMTALVEAPTDPAAPGTTDPLPVRAGLAVPVVLRHVDPPAVAAARPHARVPVADSASIRRPFPVPSVSPSQPHHAPFPLGLAAAAAAALAVLLALARMLFVPSATREGASTVREDPRCAGVAVRERPAAHRPRGGLRGAGGRVRALPPVEGRRRPHGERHRRARDARDGVGGPRGRVAA